MNVAIIGGGAAGFFCAVNLMEMTKEHNITIYEAAEGVLSKVAITGGGRCNLTNSFRDINDLSEAYPRGSKLMKKIFKSFGPLDTYQWFENHGVKLVTQDDECVFPQSQDSGEIIRTFIRLCQKYGIQIKTHHKLIDLYKEGAKFKLIFQNGVKITYDAVVIATGGYPKIERFDIFSHLPLNINPPMPSLFTFNIKDKAVTSLMGTVVEDVVIKIQGTKFKASGPLLFTHWGISGPAVLKLSSYAAIWLNINNYKARLSVSWMGHLSENDVMECLLDIANSNPRKSITTIRPWVIPARLWINLLSHAQIPLEKRWSEIGRKSLNKLVNYIVNDEYIIDGRAHYKEEFVTCGGISLEDVNHNTLEVKSCPKLFCAGEALDVDAITGGFNLQAAWSTAYIIAKELSRSSIVV